jgi:hypothetical protein
MKETKKKKVAGEYGDDRRHVLCAATTNICICLA